MTQWLSPEDQLKNYDQKDGTIEDNNLLDGNETTFAEPPRCSKNLEELFSDAIADTEFSLEVKNDTRSALIGMVDDACRMADDIGIEGVKQFELVLNEFKSWCNQKHAENISGIIEMFQTIVKRENMFQ